MYVRTYTVESLDLDREIFEIPISASELGPIVILDTPGEGDDDMGDDEDQFVIEDSTPMALPPEEAFTKVDEEMMDEKPEGTCKKKV